MTNKVTFLNLNIRKLVLSSCLVEEDCGNDLPLVTRPAARQSLPVENFLIDQEIARNKQVSGSGRDIQLNLLLLAVTFLATCGYSLAVSTL